MFRKVSLALGATLAAVGSAHASMIGDALEVGKFDPFGMFTFDSATVLQYFGMQSAVVPVPAALPLLGTGIVALGIVSRLRRKKSAE
ncbi:MAG: hypothetical protein CL534_03180 [Ahrensia sp.]|nr:hypothetical protein [Ahrensia sp.]